MSALRELHDLATRDQGGDPVHGCGCVGFYLYLTRFFTKDGKANHNAWPLCLVCKGSGVDPRIP